MAYQIPGPDGAGAWNVRRLSRVVVVIGSVLVSAFIIWQFVRGQTGRSSSDSGIEFTGWVMVDEEFRSPTGTNSVRVIITDDGALGWGGIAVYVPSDDRGQEKVFSAAPAVAELADLTVEWDNETTVRVTYTDPHRGGAVTVPITLD